MEPLKCSWGSYPLPPKMLMLILSAGWLPPNQLLLHSCLHNQMLTCWVVKQKQALCLLCLGGLGRQKIGCAPWKEIPHLHIDLLKVMNWILFHHVYPCGWPNLCFMYVTIKVQSLFSLESEFNSSFTALWPWVSYLNFLSCHFIFICKVEMIITPTS